MKAKVSERFVPYKLTNNWYIYDTITGTLIKQFVGKGTKKACIENCKLRNKVLRELS